jgi:hypothetical protein
MKVVSLITLLLLALNTIPPYAMAGLEELMQGRFDALQAKYPRVLGDELSIPGSKSKISSQRGFTRGSFPQAGNPRSNRRVE